MGKVTSLNYLRDFSNNDSNFMKDMILIFMDTIGGDLQIIEEAWQKGDYPQLKGTVHKMKPSYQFMGIIELKEDILRLEQLAKAGENPEEMKTLIEKIKEYTSLALKELKVEVQQL